MPNPDRPETDANAGEDRYDNAHIPPATPPAVEEDAQARDARELATPDGDSEADGSAQWHRPEGERSEAEKKRDAALTERDKRDGMGEPEMDRLPPD